MMSDTSAADFVPPDHADKAPARPTVSFDNSAAFSAVNPIGTSRSDSEVAMFSVAVCDSPMDPLTPPAHFSIIGS